MAWTGKYNWIVICIGSSLKNHDLEKLKPVTMNKLVRALIAGWGAKKLGGGCLGTIVVFFIIYWLLGNVHC